MTAPEIGNTPAAAVLTIARGDSWRRRLQFKQGAVDGTAIDLAGSTITAVVQQQLGGTDVFACTVTPGSTVGEVFVAFSEAQCLTLTAGSYPRDPAGVYWLVLRMLDAEGETRTLAHVRIQVVGGKA